MSTDHLRALLPPLSFLPLSLPPHPPPLPPHPPLLPPSSSSSFPSSFSSSSSPSSSYPLPSPVRLVQAGRVPQGPEQPKRPGQGRRHVRHHRLRLVHEADGKQAGASRRGGERGHQRGEGSRGCAVLFALYSWKSRPLTWLRSGFWETMRIFFDFFVLLSFSGGGGPSDSGCD